ncbi:MAG: hypothetical protein LC114_11575 [Bryobacterales bacterium]|nr:hypothetical protein [Bryobacterales bacterium]
MDSALEAEGKSAVSTEDEAPAAVAEDAASAPESASEEGFLIGRTRSGRSGRTSLLEALGETIAPEVETEESAEESVGSQAGVAPEAEGLIEETVLAAVDDVAVHAASVSLSDAGVRLDEEEVRAVVEIAVSAAMPAIVEEVSRCVLLALESRYAEKTTGAAGA